MIRILVADDHAIMRRGIRGLLETHADWHVCGEAENGREALEMTIRQAPEVVVLDLTMPELHGLDAAKAIRAAVPATEILIFTMHESEELIRAAMASGARAVVVKSDVEGHLLAAVEALLRHDVYFSSRVSATLRDALLHAPAAEVAGVAPGTLTEREREVTRLLAEGKSNKEVATVLAISVRTVETHRATIMRKLELKSIVDLVHYAVRQHLVRP
jgi:DNA-binding NarL/FixJ family response regulator